MDYIYRIILKDLKILKYDPSLVAMQKKVSHHIDTFCRGGIKNSLVLLDLPLRLISTITWFLFRNCRQKEVNGICFVSFHS